MSPLADKLNDLTDTALHTMDKLLDRQTADIIELCSDGFEWGLLSEVNVTSLEEPCTFTEAMAAPDDPKWLATCNKELTSIKELRVFKLIPKNTVDGCMIMDGKFVFRIK